MNRGQKAWLVTWCWAGYGAELEDRVAAILRPRLSRRMVGEIVEHIYARQYYTASELAYFSKRPASNPYKARWYNGICSCGHNPWLAAEYVSELLVEEAPVTGLETIKWVRPALYRMNQTTNRIEQVREAYSDSITRTITGPLSFRRL